MSGLFEQLASVMVSKQPHNDTDYYGADGLLYCGECQTPKQARMQMGDTYTLVPIMCRCAKERLDERERREQEEENARLIEELRSKSLMDERFKRQNFHAFQRTQSNEQAYKICKQYVERFPEMLEKNQGLLLYGNVGTGKTFAAACIANALLEQRIPVIMTSFVRILDAGFGSDDNELIKRLNRAKLLVIDDLGAERSTDYALEKVYNIIDSRYRVGLPMILTTNLNMTQLRNPADMRYNRIYDRVFENCFPVRFEGTSFRKSEARRRWEEMKALLED